MNAYRISHDHHELPNTERLAFALKACGIGIFDVDLRGGQAWLDENCHAMLDMKGRDEISYVQILEKIFPEDLSNVQQIIRDALQGDSETKGAAQTKIEFEFRVINGNSGISECVACCGSFYFETGTAVRFSGTVKSISKQKFREADAGRFRYMGEYAKDAVMLIREDGTFAYLNRIARDRWGSISEQDLNIGMADIDLLFDDRAFARAFAQAQQGPITPYETFYKRADGSVYDVEVALSSTVIGSENFLMAIATDVTERKQVRQQLDENQLKLQSIVSAAPVGITLFVGNELVIEMANQALIHVVGKGQNITGQSARDVMRDFKLNGQPFVDVLERVLRSENPISFQACHVPGAGTNNASNAYFDFSFIPVVDDGGKVYAILVVVVDVSGAVLAHQLLQESETKYKSLTIELEDLIRERTSDLALANQELAVFNEELSTINEELTTSAQETTIANENLAESNRLLAASNESLARFAFVASHDLQEPLRKIQQLGDLLKARYASQLGAGITYLERMQHASGRMSVLIHDLLAYSSIATKKEPEGHVSLQNVVDTVLSDLDMRIKQTGTRVSIDGPLPQVKGFASQLEQLFLNLLSNAIKFSKPGQSPYIEINHRYVPNINLPSNIKQVREARVYHCIEVKDNGIGFDQKYVDRIFEVFQRLHGQSEYTGTGIGLAICEKVAANHGGTIIASSSPGEGATFSIYLPL